jgi:hypothetical protein
MLLSVSMVNVFIFNLLVPRFAVITWITLKCLKSKAIRQ